MVNNDNIGDTMITLMIFLGILVIGILAYLAMNMILTVIGILFIVVSVEAHPDFIGMELGMLLGTIGILLVYIPLYKQERSNDDSWNR